MAHSAAALCILGLLFTGSWAQHTVTQEPTVTVTPGQTVKLSCTLGGGSTVSSNCVRFVQQKFGATPTYLLHYCSSQWKAPGIPDRYEGSGSGSVGYLTITGVLPEDEAVYYCITWAGDQCIFGDGTQLNVLSGETKAPTLSIFPPSTEEIAGKKATVVCQCQNYYPASLVWSWTMNGETINTGVDSTRPTKQTENNMFMAASFLSIEAVDWNASKNYTCIATHEGKSFQASVRESQCV